MTLLSPQFNSQLMIHHLTAMYDCSVCHRHTYMFTRTPGMTEFEERHPDDFHVCPECYQGMIAVQALLKGEISKHDFDVIAERLAMIVAWLGGRPE